MSTSTARTVGLEPRRPTTAITPKSSTNVDSTASSSSNSASGSPSDSPRRSASQTSLSSMSSLDEAAPQHSKDQLVDSHGNVFELPDYTIKQIRDAIPAHCYERSALKGFSYIARDIACLATTFYIFYNYVTPEYIPSIAVRTGLWAIYTVMQGMFGTGLWVIAHECGHQSFSNSKTLNDTVGWVLHSSLLVPYFSWKISHGKHHKATGHLERDMVFQPTTRERYATRLGVKLEQVHELMEETPIWTALTLTGQQLVGWLLYIFNNTTGHNFHEKQVEGKGKGKQNGFMGGVNHFIPSSPLYEKKDEHLILLSDLGLAIVLGTLYFLGHKFGGMNMFVWYWIPYLWVNHWLVAITFLQHTDPTLPHYSPDSWNFVRGAAATIDRDFGFIGRHLFHGIIETHVLHHYVSTIPFYNADEASEAIKPVMGRHYRANVEGGMFGFLTSLWKVARRCQWIERADQYVGSDSVRKGGKVEGEGVWFYRNRNGYGLPPAKMEAK